MIRFTKHSKARMRQRGVAKDWYCKVGRSVAIVTDDGVVRTSTVLWKSGHGGRPYRNHF